MILPQDFSARKRFGCTTAGLGLRPNPTCDQL